MTAPVDPRSPRRASIEQPSTARSHATGEAAMIRPLLLLEDRDLDWVRYVADVVTKAVGQPWRVALDRLETAPDRMSARTHAAIVGAVQRVVGGRTRHAKQARRARELVLGAPALDAADRAARVEAAAKALAVTPDAFETLLWSDVPRERPIELRGSLSEAEIAAHANLFLLQKAVRRAHAVTIRVWGDAGPLLRAANARGLLVSPSIGAGGETIAEIIGPLALCHRTAVYGRAISGIVPLLAACDRFDLVVAGQNDYGAYETHARSPVLLPEPPVELGGVSRAATRLAGQLARLLGLEPGRSSRTAAASDPASSVMLAPAATATGHALAAPDLAVEIAGERWLVELVGFWTTPYLERKLRGYGRANVILCIDEARACADDAPPAEALLYQRTLDAAAVLARMRPA